jgi:hypothetical protein
MPSSMVEGRTDRRPELLVTDAGLLGGLGRVHEAFAPLRGEHPFNA